MEIISLYEDLHEAPTHIGKETNGMVRKLSISDVPPVNIEDKNDEERQVFVNYKQRNEIIKPDPDPLARINDLRNYRNYTAETCPRIISQVPRYYEEQFKAKDLNDLTIYSKILTERPFSHVQQAFKVFRQENMKAKRKKTYLHLPNRLLPGYNMERYLPDPTTSGKTKNLPKLTNRTRLRPPPLELFPYRKHRRSCQIATRPITKKIVKNKRKSVPNRLTKVLLNFGVQRSKFHQKTPPKNVPEQLRRTQESEVNAAKYLHELPTHDEIDNQTGESRNGSKEIDLVFFAGARK